MATRVAKVAVDLAANSAEFTSGLNRANAALNSSARQWQKHLSAMDAQMAAAMATAKAGLAGLAGGLGVAELSRSLYDVNSRFQDLRSGLETAMGSSKAAAVAFSGIREFAKDTPYELAEVVTAFARLKNLGLDPANEALTAWGDMASSFPNKTLTDVIEAVADATTGEFERLKEFGIQASSQGNKVSFTFKGVTTTVSKSADAIDAYLRKLSADNFGGAMAKRMANLSGLASNLKDAFDDLLVTIGEMGTNKAMEEMLKGLTSAIGAAADNMGAITSVGGAAAAAIGGMVVARTAAAAIAAMQTANVSAAAGLSMLNTFGTATTARMVAMAAATGTASVAMRGLTAALALVGGPVGAGIAAASAAIYLMATHQTAAEQAAVSHSRAMAAFNGVIDVSKGRVKDLTAEVKALRKAQLEAAADAAKAAIAQQEIYAHAGNFKIDRVAFESGLSKQDAAALVAPARELQKAYLDGAISASELYAKTAALADQDQRLKPLVQIMSEWAEPLTTARQELQELEAALAVLNGTASETQKKLVLPSIDAPARSPKVDTGAAKHADAVAKQVADLQFQREQLSRTSREQEIYAALKQNGLSISSEEGRKVAELAGRLYDEKAAREAAADAIERQNKLEEDRLDQQYKGVEALDDYISGLERELTLIGMGADAREQNEAMLQAENIAREHGIEVTDEQRARIGELTTAKQALISEENEHKAVLQELENVGEQAFDRIGSAATEMAMQGEDAFGNLRNVGLAVVSELYQEFFKLAAWNPLKNMIFGGNAVTLSSVGGLLGKLFSSTGSSTASYTTAVNSGVGIDGMATGGRIAGNGRIIGPGSGTSDDILAAVSGGGMLRVSNGESIVNAEATAKYWPLIDAMNNGRLPAFADGGVVGGVTTSALSAANINSPGRAGGDQYYIDARGADREGLARLEAMIRATNASVERRAVAAVTSHNGRTVKKGK
ncbi:hypothetical protein [Magnetospirillum aberrantis]|uniref:Tape measure protein N-terminal domain-containing protein n=1 Tax=Magnetospirillum aberrantis SpK TaxID=908842 RepID=A0A7C9UYT6_9PROT|nr:hypothetical protein [Magnetospirillum aberrantis]NFV79993.1 hypothetical protein [Magnetospirillum aberrantis SpK]